jgi:predicted metalloprotease with PDZ domain
MIRPFRRNPFANRFPVGLALAALVVFAAPAWSQAPVTYRLSFPEPAHRWAQVEVVFPDLGSGPLEAHMSRSSPGRYAVHEFAKNVFDVRAFDGRGRPLALDRPNAQQWTVAGHDGTVRITYRIYGDRTDGTFLGVDTTHAHVNIPATLMWARGLESRPVRVTFVRPSGTTWKVATQLHPTADPLTFMAANLQYLMDSPAEFSDFTLRTFTVNPNATIRVAVHQTAREGDVDQFVGDVAKLVREERAVFGEYPDYDVGSYTFLVDCLPYANGDGMEHRNSTVVTLAGSLGSGASRNDLLGTIAHEFFHSWNIERIRPRSLEPFNFDDANVSGELWLGEGFTSYYQILVMQRTGLASLDETAEDFANTIDTVVRSPGRTIRSAVDMSRLAPFVDAARWIDRTNWDNLYISYYTWGAALGLGLDLALRDRTNNRVTLDDYMRAMWRVHGRPPGTSEGLVGVPYTLGDARDRLAEVSGDRTFADQFFDRFVEGREAVDYAPLLQRAGLVLRKRHAGRAWLGEVPLSFGRSSARLLQPALIGSPLHRAGLDQDDEIMSLDGEPMSSSGQLGRIEQRHKPGDAVPIVFLRRGARTTASLTLDEDPRLEVVPAEGAGGALTAAERAFRDAWLNTRQ